jgi:carbonic anhydrase
MDELDRLFENNRAWSKPMRDHDGRFFSRLAEQQAPRYRWIGCADSRVPANEIIGLQPGEVFVHRNVANRVVHTDLNIQYAVDLLRVRHVMVVGHYGCGGIQAELEQRELGLANHWLQQVENLRDVRDRPLALHGLIYGVHDGLLRNLGATLSGPTDLTSWRAAALRALWQRPARSSASAGTAP